MCQRSIVSNADCDTAGMPLSQVAHRLFQPGIAAAKSGVLKGCPTSKWLLQRIQ